MLNILLKNSMYYDTNEITKMASSGLAVLSNFVKKLLCHVACVYHGIIIRIASPNRRMVYMDMHTLQTMIE